MLPVLVVPAPLPRRHFGASAGGVHPIINALHLEALDPADEVAQRHRAPGAHAASPAARVHRPSASATRPVTASRTSVRSTSSPACPLASTSMSLVGEPSTCERDYRISRSLRRHALP